jgi:serine/threonine-protein kinase
MLALGPRFMSDPLRFDPLTEPPSDTDPWPGTTLADKYGIGPMLGEGGMGRVYRAVRLPDGQAVAVKILHPQLGSSPAIVQRFRREAGAARRFAHPHAVRVLDSGSTRGGVMFLVMELLEGEDLQTILDHDAPLAPGRIVDLLVQSLRAIDDAHRAGIVHRDLKPENLFVTNLLGRDHVKVCDFGLAKILDGADGTTAITKDGYVCGTPEYMAPEQARGATLDARTDVYAVGVVLYQMLTGRIPFEAATPLAVLDKHVRETPVPPRLARPDLPIPRALEQIALRALAKRPEDRYPSAAAMADALERAVREPTTTERPAPRSRTPSSEWSALWTFGLLASIAVFAFGVWLWLG